MNRPSRHELPIIAIAFVAAPTAAHAYIDPGTAGFVITSVLGFLAAAGYVVRGWFGRLKRRVFGGGEPAEDGGGEGADAGDGRTGDGDARG